MTPFFCTMKDQIILKKFQKIENLNNLKYLKQIYFQSEIGNRELIFVFTFAIREYMYMRVYIYYKLYRILDS